MTLSAPGLAPRLTQCFALILKGLSDEAAARMSKPTTVRQQVAFPLLMLLWGRLRRTLRRFAAIAANPGAAAPARRPARPRTRKPSEQNRLPSGFGWVVKLLPEAAVFGSQLQYFLTDPEMAALIAADPKMAGLLRPLCRMLAVPGPPKPAPAKTAAVIAVDAEPPTSSADPRQGGEPPGPSSDLQSPGSTDLISPSEACIFEPA